MKIVNKNFEELKSKIARSVRDVLQLEARTPEGEKPTVCEVFVSYNQLIPIEEEENTAHAVVGYAVSWVKEKRHSVNIKFKYDNTGRFIRDTMVYV